MGIYKKTAKGNIMRNYTRWDKNRLDIALMAVRFVPEEKVNKGMVMVAKRISNKDHHSSKKQCKRRLQA
jgi:hypothetical protein